MDSVGKPRAEIVCELLWEMNADMKGYARVGNFQNILDTEPNYFARFNLVICANIPRYQVSSLAQHCWEKFVPFICARSVDFLGSINVQAREHFITEVRSDSIKHDLRISQPFPALKQLTDTILPPHCTYAVRESNEAGPCEEKNDHLLVMGSFFCSHIPFPLLLLRMLTTWQQPHRKQTPVFLAEKNELCQLIKTFDKGISQPNVTEALKEVSCCWTHLCHWLCNGSFRVDQTMALKVTQTMSCFSLHKKDCIFSRKKCFLLFYLLIIIKIATVIMLTIIIITVN